MKKKKKLDRVMIKLPEGLYYETLEVGAQLHGAPSLSKYILTAALSYTKQCLEERAEYLKGQEDEKNRERASDSLANEAEAEAETQTKK
tara:strand:- start:69 stop:335 length:267 start_codon:yes stop_codon:yes gene_type:complete